MKRTVITSPDMTDEMRAVLKGHGIESITLPRTDRVARPISGHPDMQVFLYGDSLFCHPDIDIRFLKMIDSRISVTLCKTRLSSTYPGDVPYNIACTNGTAFHRTDATDPLVSQYFEDSGIKSVHVKQGYAKCSTCIAGPGRIITADRGIHRNALTPGLESLLIEPGHILLPGYSHGLIGGASGATDEFVYFTGRLDRHPDYGQIMEFIENSGKNAVFLSDKPAVDLGSLLIF